ncbi:MAG: type IV secretion system DNA-binding domain-containing protein [Planctomycetales bacterium]|nr:MAG: type IV secretion system DNA-binding domain-containing protein [Planctomycetales bacterium]
MFPQFGLFWNFVLSTLVYLLYTAVAIGIIWGIRASLTGFMYHMEDYTTGFLKVRDLANAANAEALWILQNHTPDELYGEYSLAIGDTKSSGFANTLMLPGDFRSTHMYVVGASGAGKSSLLKNFIVQDIASGMGFCVIDPHGDLITDSIPHLNERREQAVLLDLADMEHMLPYNPLQRREGVPIAEQVARLLLAFKRVWEDSWGARMEDILRHTLALLIEHNLTLHQFEQVLVDADFRDMLLAETSTDTTKDFFFGRYNVWNSKERTMFIESSLNKVSAFLADPRIGARLGQVESGFNVREIMDSGGILLVNLAKGRLGLSADLFGAMLMADIESSFLTRGMDSRRPFALYADEFQNIATESFATVLTEARKFGLCLTMAHQSLKQLDDKLLALILGNCQTQIYFRVARQDAERLAKESSNIVKQLEQREAGLLQEPVNKFSLPEMWEVAFHSLARLEQRKAYLMVKGAMEHPELIKTHDNLIAPKRNFPYNEEYRPHVELKDQQEKRKKNLMDSIDHYLEGVKEGRKDASKLPPEVEGLGFIDKD